MSKHENNNFEHYFMTVSCRFVILVLMCTLASHFCIDDQYQIDSSKSYGGA